MKDWLWGIKHVNGQYERVAGNTIEEALGVLGWKAKDMRRYMPIKYLGKPPMPEEVKQKLRALNEERRSLRKGGKP